MPISNQLWQTVAEPFIEERLKWIAAQIEIRKLEEEKKILKAELSKYSKAFGSPIQFIEKGMIFDDNASVDENNNPETTPLDEDNSFEEKVVCRIENSNSPPPFEDTDNLKDFISNRPSKNSTNEQTESFLRKLSEVSEYESYINSEDSARVSNIEIPASPSTAVLTSKNSSFGSDPVFSDITDDENIDEDQMNMVFNSSAENSPEGGCIWVECEKCKKWRYLYGLKDAALVPNSWNCSMLCRKVEKFF